MEVLAPPVGVGIGAAVALRGAVCLRDGHPVLKGAELTIGRGEALLVTGANGAGKSTLLRVLAGLAPLAAGQGFVLGHDLRAHPGAVRRSVALVGHEDFCYVDLTVRENVIFQARAAGADVARVDEWLDRLGLSALARRRAGRLSAGQRKRCALAVALVRDADLLMLDEPHAALDAAGREIVDEVVGHAVARGVTVVLVSHDRDRARPLVDREVTVVDGTILENTPQ